MPNQLFASLPLTNKENESRKARQKTEEDGALLRLSASGNAI
jgi:hypothetical protein